MVNRVILVGNLGRDPEMKASQGGLQIATFSLATSRRSKDRDGNRQDETEWHNVVCFGRQAEIAGQYLRKGKQIYVEGRIKTRSWDDKESGKKQYRTEIVCENFQMLGSRGEGGAGGGGGASYGGSGSGGGSDYDGGGGGGQDMSDDDIPF